MVIFFFGGVSVFFIMIRRPNLARSGVVCAWKRRKNLRIGTQSDGDAKSQKNIVSVLVMQFRPRKLCIYRRVFCIPRLLDGLGGPGVPAAEVSIRLPVIVSESSKRNWGRTRYPQYHPRGCRVRRIDQRKVFHHSPFLSAWCRSS